MRFGLILPTMGRRVDIDEVDGAASLAGRLSRMGVIIFPPVPAWYNQPTSLDEAIDHLVGRMLDQFGMRSSRVKRWNGMRSKLTEPSD